MPPKKSSRVTMEGDGLFDEIKLGNLPSSVQAFYKKHKDKKIDKMEIFRRPVGDAIEGALNAFTGNSVDKFFKQTPYDTLFHLGIIINDKFLFHKQENFTLSSIPGGLKKFLKGKDMEISQVSGYGDITIKDLFRRTRDKMGEKKFYGYDAFKNNCQDFVVAALESVGATFDKDFVKQDLKKLADKIPSFTQEVGNAFTGFARGARQLIGLGGGDGGAEDRGAEDRGAEDRGAQPPPPRRRPRPRPINTDLSSLKPRDKEEDADEKELPKDPDKTHTYNRKKGNGMRPSIRRPPHNSCHSTPMEGRSVNILL